MISSRIDTLIYVANCSKGLFLTRMLCDRPFVEYQIPKSILNGKIIKVQRRRRKIRVEYRCNEGYWMQGEANNVWSKGKWKRNPPVCISKCLLDQG